MQQIAQPVQAPPKPQGEPVRSRFNWLPIAILVGFFCLSVAVISPLGNFPLNDDWSYGVEAQQWAQTGAYVRQADMAACVLHVAIGALATKLLGFSYTTLRLINISFGLMGGIAFYACLREVRLRASLAALFALVLMANPLYLNLCFTYMSDVPAIACANLFMLFALKTIRRNRAWHILLCGLSLVATLAMRQSYMVFLLPLAAVMFLQWRGQGKNLLRAAALIGLPMAFLFLSEKVFHIASIQPTTYSWLKGEFLKTITGFAWHPQSSLWNAAAAFGQLLCYLGLFCAPLLLAFMSAPSVVGGALRRHKVLLGISSLPVVATLIKLVVQEHRLMPFNQNLLRIPVVGSLTIMGINIEALRPKARGWLTGISCTLAVVLLYANLLFTQRTLALFAKSRRHSDERRATAAFCLIATGASLAFLVLQIMVRDIDRYYLMALPPTLLSLAMVWRWLRIPPRWLCTSLVLGLMAIYSTLATQDYMNWNRARWQLTQRLESQGVSYNHIDGGYEYNYARAPGLNRCYVIVKGRLCPLHQGVPPRDLWRWWGINGEQYIISFSPIPDYNVVERQSYWSPLSWKRRDVLALKTTAPVDSDKDLSPVPDQRR